MTTHDLVIAIAFRHADCLRLVLTDGLSKTRSRRRHIMIGINTLIAGNVHALIDELEGEIHIIRKGGIVRRYGLRYTTAKILIRYLRKHAH